ncbi:ferredoxin [Candidatus Poribacteria bacterium]
MNMAEEKNRITRRDFIRNTIRGACLLGLGSTVGVLVTRSQASDVVWQLDPYKCIQCGQCATHCVLEDSAVKCVHKFAMCGYCKLCTGYFESQPNALNTGAENQLCPTGAIQRGFVEHPYYEYTIDETLCVGCGKCVKGCAAFGNGSLFLQVRHDRCLNCNDCSIASACPSQAFKRVPAKQPYLLKEG